MPGTFRALIVAGLVAFAGLEAQAQATSKPQFIWNKEEREAVETVKAWMAAFATKDPQKIAQYMDENCVFRGDPSQPMQKGREAFIKEVSAFIGIIGEMKLDEIYVTGAEWDTSVLTKRTDVLSASAPPGMAGKAIPLAAFFRVKNKKITEWLDVPLVPLPAPPPPPAARGKQQ